VRFEVLTAADMEMADFWVAASIIRANDRPDDGGNKYH
jgi:hypothetical protein